MPITIENKIRLNIALIFVIAAVLCGAIVLFFYHDFGRLDVQKQRIEQYDRDMSAIVSLIDTINHAQEVANLYITTKEPEHLEAFRRRSAAVVPVLDQLRTHLSDSLSGDIVRQLALLNMRKEATILELKQQFESLAAPLNVKQRLKSYPKPSVADAGRTKSSIVRDTIRKIQPKKSFWKRLTGVFSSNEAKDTIIMAEKVDTLRATAAVNRSFSKDINRIADRIERDYDARTASIEEQVIQLIMLDQEISSKISTLLIDLYNNMLSLRLQEIKESEQWLQRNNTISIAGGMVALFLIMLFLIFIVHDVNKGLQMRKALERTQEQMKQLLESRHRLLLSVSHDIKTPLNSILGYIELNADRMDEAVSMQNSGRYILALLENLLEFSALEQGTLAVHANNYEPYRLCTEITDMFHPLAQQKGLVLAARLEVSPDVCLFADELKTRQVIINVLSNAVKYTVQGRIDFGVSVADGRLCIRVTDTGVGIPASQIDQIFKPFTRIDAHSNVAEGSGFGMYVVKGLVDLMQGTISVASEINVGTTVTIELPVECVADNRAEAAPTASRRIWAIDDDPTFLNLLTNMLARLGHTVTASSTREAFEQCLKQQPKFDLALTDMELGPDSGIDILRLIRGRYTDLPVFAVTGRGDFSLQQAHESGFDGYLAKPVTMASLASLIGGAVRRADRLESLREMFDNDEEAIREILSVFIDETAINLQRLRRFVAEGLFAEAQALSHKMLPMFLQTGLTEAAEFLKKMDLLRGHPESDFPEWRAAGEAFIELAGQEMVLLKAELRSGV